MLVGWLCLASLHVFDIFPSCLKVVSFPHTYDIEILNILTCIIVFVKLLFIIKEIEAIKVWSRSFKS